MNAVLKSPFDPYVAQILSNPQYLSQMNATALLAVIKRVFPSLDAASSPHKPNVSPQELLSDTISALAETIKKMNMAAATNEGGMNTADLKKIVDAQEKQIKILARLSEVLTANERQTALENALIEAMDETENKAFKESFLSKFHVKLGQKSQKLGSLG